MPVSVPIASQMPVAGLADRKKLSSAPSAAEAIVASIQPIQEADDQVDKLIQQDVQIHNVLVWNAHTKTYEPNYALHSLLAYHYLNAPASVLRSRYLLESRMLERLPTHSATDVTKIHPLTELGQGVQGAPMLSLTRYYTDHLRSHGAPATLRHFLPSLIDGPDMFALTHLHLGLQHKQMPIVAQALALWTLSHKVLLRQIPGPATDSYDQASMIEILQDAREEPLFQKLPKKWPDMPTSARLQYLDSMELNNFYEDLARSWANANLDELMDAVLLVGTTTAHLDPRPTLDFHLAQILRAANVLPILIEHLPKEMHRKLLISFMLSFIRLYVAQGAPAINPPRIEVRNQEEVPNWDELTPDWTTYPDTHILHLLKTLHDYAERAPASAQARYRKAAKIVIPATWEWRGAGFGNKSWFRLRNCGGEETGGETGNEDQE